MKKILFSFLILFSNFFFSQFTGTSVGKEYITNIFILENTLYYNNGSVGIINGKIDNYGNFYLKKLSSSDFFNPNEKFVLKLNNPSNYLTSKYGQLIIKDYLQNQISTAIVKEYLAKKNGSMQQMSLPFYNKSLTSLANDLGFSSFSNLRNTNAVGYWDNKKVVMHNLPASSTTLSNANLDTNLNNYNNSTRYYAVGTYSWNPEFAPNSTYKLSGIPFADKPFGTIIIENLENAGYENSTTPINYGTNGTKLNMYNEKYSTYLSDDFDLSTQGYFNGSFGRNIYQFSNPFFSNIDLSLIGYIESAPIGDDNNINNIQGIKFESVGVTTTSNGTFAQSIKYVTFDNFGIPVGDINSCIIKPMQNFVIKLKNNLPQTLNFDKLRTFSSIPRAENVSYNYGINKKFSNQIKQLRIIGLNENKEEIATTYYVVGNNLETGHNINQNVQVTTTSNKIYTQEENVGGFEDVNYNYHLYINQANSVDYSSKPISLHYDTSLIKYLKFQLADSGVELPNDSNFNDMTSFYLKNINTGDNLKLQNNTIVKLNDANFNIYYEKENALSTNDGVNKKTTNLLYDAERKDYLLLLSASEGKNATILIYDSVGNLINKISNVSTSENKYLNITKITTGFYIVKVIYSNANKIYNFKILKK